MCNFFIVINFDNAVKIILALILDPGSMFHCQWLADWFASLATDQLGAVSVVPLNSLEINRYVEKSNFSYNKEKYYIRCTMYTR